MRVTNIAWISLETEYHTVSFTERSRTLNGVLLMLPKNRGADRSHRSGIQQGAEKVLCPIRRTDGVFPG